MRSRTERWASVLRGALLAATLGLTFVGGIWLALRFAAGHSPVVRAPSVVGLDAAAAEQALRAAGLNPEVAGRRFDASAPEGRVLQQTPAAGSETRPGRPVRLVVSLGVRRATVPDLVGSSASRADATLTAAQFALGDQADAPDPGVPPGRVLAQDPPAGAEAAPGDKVALLVSDGAPPRVYVMPNLVGRPAADVLQVLARAGFKRVRTQGAGTEGTVSAQDPAAGKPVGTEDALTVTVGAP